VPAKMTMRRALPKPRFVAGAVGPTNKTLSVQPQRGEPRLPARAPSTRSSRRTEEQVICFSFPELRQAANSRFPGCRDVCFCDIGHELSYDRQVQRLDECCCYSSLWH